MAPQRVAPLNMGAADVDKRQKSAWRDGRCRTLADRASAVRMSVRLAGGYGS